MMNSHCQPWRPYAHGPYAEGNGLWRQKGLGAFKTALDRSWKPYLEGHGTLGEALRAVLKG